MPAQTLAPETPATRRARQFAMLHAMADRSFTLACSASNDALREDEAARAATPPARPNRAREHRLDFCRLSAAVRQTIGIEMRLEDVDRPRPASRTFTPQINDPRRPLLRDAFHAAVASDPDRARRRREIDLQIDQHLAADPDRTIPLPETVAALCDELDIDLDVSRVPDELLGMPPRVLRPPTRASP